MIINEEYFALEDQALQLVETICSGETMASYKEARRLLSQNKAANAKIKAFNEAKEAYERVEAYPNFAPDYAEIKAARLPKPNESWTWMNQSIAFGQRNANCNCFWIKFPERLAHAVSPNILVSAGDPFFPIRGF